MKRFFCGCVVALAAVGGTRLHLDAAGTAKFKYAAAVYFDAKGGGFGLPEGVACDRNGAVVIGDTGNNRLVRFTYRDKAFSGGTEIKIPELTSPAVVYLNSKGDIFALDSQQRRVVHLGPAGEFKETLKFDGAPNAGTVVVKSFALDAADNIYVLDAFSARVLVLNPQGQFQAAIALAADTGFGSDISVDASGSVFLIDSIKRRLYAAAKGADAFAPAGGNLGQFIATLPTRLTAVDGTIFVVEGNGSTVDAFARDGSFLARQLTMGWSEGALNHPAQVCVNDKGEAFIADRDNSRVQSFELIR